MRDRLGRSLSRISRPALREDQVLWLLERLDGLDPRRKSRLAGLAFAQAARGLGRRHSPQGHRLEWLLLATSSACNLRCAGCYARPEWRDPVHDPAALSYVAREADALGVNGLPIVGWGEPFLRRDETESLFRMARAHPGLFVPVFTNGTTLGESELSRLARTGNVFPILSLDGLESSHDARRGPGVFDRVRRTAIELCRRSIPFAVAVTVSRANHREVVSSLFVDAVRDWGPLGALYLRFIPARGDPASPGLMLRESEVAEYFDGLRTQGARQPMPLVDSDEAEARFGGCAARRGALAFVDVAGDRIAGCVRLPSPSPVGIVSGRVPGRLARALERGQWIRRR